jgi:FKBP-type peptidyl-prolyl cis-trans isomerase SlyD
MEIADRCVVAMHYTLTNQQGETLDSSAGHGPLVYLHGFGNIIPGLEKALVGAKAGDKLDVTVAPEEAYGVRDERLVQNVPRRAFQGIRDIQPGMSFTAQGEGGMPTRVVVQRVAGDIVTIDANHPLAGETLRFAVEIASVREASEEELAHGHVHGEGGHHH